MGIFTITTSKFAATASAVSGAALITLGGVWFAPKPLVPLPVGPTTEVPVNAVLSGNADLADGDVKTTVFHVSGTGKSARVGAALSTTTSKSFKANLPNGQYLVKSVPVGGKNLSNLDDTDGTAEVPTGAGCGDRLGCTWIWVDNSRENDTWGLIGTHATHKELEFTYQRPSEESSTTSPPAGAPTVPTTRTMPPPVAKTPTTTGTTQPVPAGTTQDITLDVTEFLNGGDISVPGVRILVTHTDSAGRTFAQIGVTGPAGGADFTIPTETWSAHVIFPGNYQLVFHSHPGVNPSAAAGDLTIVSVGLLRLPNTTPIPQPPVAESSPPASSTTPAPVNSTPPPAAQPDSTVPVQEPAPTTTTAPATDTPATSVPTETMPTTPAPTETVPTETVPTETVPTETVPATTVPTEPASQSPGCDETNDPEYLALLSVNDGIIRWVQGGELHTVVPLEGMSPVLVCEAAYARLTGMGFDPGYFRLG